MNKDQLQRLEEGFFRLLWKEVCAILYPCKSIPMPQLPEGKTIRDGMFIKADVVVTWADRLRLLFCSHVQIDALVACEKVPGYTAANANFTILPPFIGKRENPAAEKAVAKQQAAQLNPVGGDTTQANYP